MQLFALIELLLLHELRKVILTPLCSRKSSQSSAKSNKLSPIPSGDNIFVTNLTSEAKRKVGWGADNGNTLHIFTFSLFRLQTHS